MRVFSELAGEAEMEELAQAEQVARENHRLTIRLVTVAEVVQEEEEQNPAPRRP